MGHKGMNFYAMCWFISVLICMVLEGSYLGAHGTNTIWNELVPFTWFHIGNTVAIPAFNLNFFHGVARILLWDYSFYNGGFQIIRWFWMLVLSPGAVWGIGQMFVFVYAQFLSRVIGI